MKLRGLERNMGQAQPATRAGVGAPDIGQMISAGAKQVGEIMVQNSAAQDEIQRQELEASGADQLKDLEAAALTTDWWTTAELDGLGVEYPEDSIRQRQSVDGKTVGMVRGSLVASEVYRVKSDAIIEAHTTGDYSPEVYSQVRNNLVKGYSANGGYNVAVNQYQKGQQELKTNFTLSLKNANTVEELNNVVADAVSKGYPEDIANAEAAEAFSAIEVKGYTTAIYEAKTESDIDALRIDLSHNETLSAAAFENIQKDVNARSTFIRAETLLKQQDATADRRESIYLSDPDVTVRSLKEDYDNNVIGFEQLNSLLALVDSKASQVPSGYSNRARDLDTRWNRAIMEVDQTSNGAGQKLTVSARVAAVDKLIRADIAANPKHATEGLAALTKLATAANSALDDGSFNDAKVMMKEQFKIGIVGKEDNANQQLAFVAMMRDMEEYGQRAQGRVNYIQWFNENFSRYQPENFVVAERGKQAKAYYDIQKTRWQDANTPSQDMPFFNPTDQDELNQILGFGDNGNGQSIPRVALEGSAQHAFSLAKTKEAEELYKDDNAKLMEWYIMMDSWERDVLSGGFDREQDKDSFEEFLGDFYGAYSGKDEIQ